MSDVCSSDLAREIAGEGLGYPLEGGVVQQQLEPERLARSDIGQGLVADLPAGLPEEIERRPQIAPQLARVVGARRHEGPGEQPIGMSSCGGREGPFV